MVSEQGDQPVPMDPHFVARGLQDNFATDDQRVAIFDTKRGELLDAEKSTESNFVDPDVGSSAMPDEWQEVEATDIPILGEISTTTCGERELAAVGKVFAMHLVRSRPYRAAHDLPVDDVEKLLSSYHALVAQFSKCQAQVIVSPDSLPGFVLGDVPVAHIERSTARMGFPDLAVEDADLIFGSVARRTVVCLTPAQEPHVTLTTKKMLQRINAALWRTSEATIACHPDDRRETHRFFEHLDTLTLSGLL